MKRNVERISDYEVVPHGDLNLATYRHLYCRVGGRLYAIMHGNDGFYILKGKKSFYLS